MTPKSDRLIKTGAAGTIIAALCCATPLLVISLSALGLGAITGSLDYVLLPALAICVAIVVYGLILRRKEQGACRPKEQAGTTGGSR